MLSYSTLILILAIMLMVASVISMIVALYIGLYIDTSPSYVSEPKLKRSLIMSIVFLIGGLALLTILSTSKQTDTAYNRYVRETSPDAGYSIYYNGQAVSGRALGIDRENFDDFDIKYDEKNKIIKIMQKR